ncbi:hypothetical protein [Alkaliflexus imshenetskii]|nr:hypothetical protein [Alkaliflexus imshenetskii]
MTTFEIIILAGAVLVLAVCIIGDIKASKRPNQPTHHRPEPWDKTYED